MSFEVVRKRALELVRRDTGHVPIVIVQGSRRGTVIALDAIPDTHMERRRAMRALGYQIFRDANLGKLEEVFMVHEGWLSQAKGGKMPDKLPSEDPERIEILMIAAQRIGDEQPRIEIFEMVRDKKGDVVELKEYEPMKNTGDSVSSRTPLLDSFIAGYRMGEVERLN